MGVGLRVLVVGSGGREHALAWACARSPLVAEVLCAPGNGGTAAVATNLAVAEADAPALARMAVDRAVDLVVIGPDGAIAAGVADACTAAGIRVAGPTAAAGRIESSKAFAKELMDRAGIPTARWWVGDDLEELAGRAAELGGRCVIKADGLARGKGVTVCATLAEARAAIAACITDHRFGEAGRRVLVEQRLEGPELSLFALSDGRHVRLLGAARDYKRADDGDRGPNTGGMGAVAPLAELDADTLEGYAAACVRPCIEALADAGTPFHGCLYAGLMLCADGPRVIEYNARLGDPEAQPLLSMLADDPIELLKSVAEGSLLDGSARLLPGSAVGVVIAAAGYPDAPRAGDPVGGLDAVPADVLAFHAGTRATPSGLVTAGGRVLTMVGRGQDVAEARARAYAGVAAVSFPGAWSRSDIGHAGGVQ
ncbi:MAG: phosphoribosylamine--glycine ligase [Candidatus Dormibacteria bacterium]